MCGLHAATRAPLWEIVRMASLTPAERTGLAHDTGSLAVGHAQAAFQARPPRATVSPPT